MKNNTINNNKGTLGKNIEKEISKARKCRKCKSIFIKPEGARCPVCGIKLNRVKMIIWN